MTDQIQTNGALSRGTPVAVDDEAVRNQIFDNSPALEQERDPDLAGTAIVVEVDTVRGRGAGAMIIRSRPPDPANAH